MIRRPQSPQLSKRKPEKLPLTCLSLFAGAGGFSEGFRQGGFKVVAANDADAWAGATYHLNHAKHGTRFVLGDISKLTVQRQILEALDGLALDAVIGGPPCQAFSQVRNHDRVINDPRNKLYRHYVSMLQKLRPRTFVMENVPGLENIARGRARQQILEDLALDGEYRVEARVLDAAEFGVPQNRLRVLFIGVREDLRIAPRFPLSPWNGALPVLERQRAAGRRGAWAYTHRPDLITARALTELFDPKSERLVTVEQAIGDLAWLKPNDRLVRRPSDEAIAYEEPPASAYQRARRSRSKELFNADVPSIREDTVARLLSIPLGGNFRDLPESLTARYLNGTKWGPELGRKNLSRKYFFAYRKLHPHHFSWTLNTKADCVFHYDTPRALTVREFARLHSFDDTYHFLAGDRHSRYRQVGNALPPLFAKAIAETLASILAEADAPRVVAAE